MREILFRGKTPDGMWIFGDYIKGAEKTPELCVIKERTLLRHNYLCYSDTVGQYTGMKDKNGMKIFEGDLVLCKIIGIRETVIHKGTVEYLNDSFTVNIKGIVPPQNIIWFSIKNGDIEVIGNIHDSPELLAQQPKNN